MRIKLENLKKTYKAGKNTPQVQAVKNISLEIPSNCIYGIIGKSGAGKSTLVRLISLLEEVDSGCVYYDEKRVDNLKKNELIAQRRRIGMIFQNFNLFSSRTAAQNIAYPMEICGTPKEKIKNRVEELLSLVDLSGRGNAAISTLSGGQKQRVAIARALACNPDILFCDEATSALDPQTTKSILELIKKIQSQMNLTVVMITHQMEVVRDACDLVAVVNDGQVVESGSVNEIFTNPQSEVTKDFLSHISSNTQLVQWAKNNNSYILTFPDKQQNQPVLSELAKKFDVNFNILAAGVQHLTDSSVGKMTVSFTGSDDELKKAFAFLEEKGVKVFKENFTEDK